MNIIYITLTMAIVTAFTRFLPFILLRGETPPYISYLGKVLPSAIIGMLVVYCLKDINFVAFPFALPEIIRSISVVALQIFKRNSILSILAGTCIYMLLINIL